MAFSNPGVSSGLIYQITSTGVYTILHEYLCKAKGCQASVKVPSWIVSKGIRKACKPKPIFLSETGGFASSRVACASWKIMFLR